MIEQVISCKWAGKYKRRFANCSFCNRDYTHLRVFHLKKTYEKTSAEKSDFVVKDFSVVCGCGASGPTKDTESKAIRAWNTRRNI